MAFLTTSFITDLLLAFVTIVGLLCIYVLNIYKYWAKKGVPYVKPKFPFGAMTEVIFQKKSYTQIISEAYTIMKKNRYIGFFSFFSPGIIINDLDLMKRMMVQDFNHFSDRGIYSNKKVDPLSAHLIATDGPEWKLMKSKINPCFTSNKLKNMFDIVVTCGEQLQNYVATESSKRDALEWKDVFGRYGYTVIAQIAFGIETNSFEKGSTKFFDMIRQILEPSMIQGLRISLSFYGTSLAKLLNMRVYPKHVTDFYNDVVRDTVHYREANHVSRNDLMQLLMELRGNEALKSTNTSENISKEADMSLTMNEMTAHAFMFFAAGFESPSSTLSFCAYELALNPDIQKKLLEEVDGLEGELTFENLHKMSYLDMVINETLRKYPPVGLSKRICTQDYKIPQSDLVIEKGTIVIFPIRGVHMNPEHFPEPEKFFPERFGEENVKNIKPFSYLPFGEGPRMCIAMRFALMQMKIAMVQLLKKFELQVAAKTPIPIVFEPKSILSNVAGGMWLKAVERRK